MFCKYCGAEVADDAKFCPRCGKQIAAKDSSTGNADQPVDQTDQPVNHTENFNKVESEQPIDNSETFSKVKTEQPQSSPVLQAGSIIGIGRSMLMLAFSICLSIEILFGLFGYVASVLNVLAIIISIIVCVGCWLVYASSSQNRAPTAGFSVLRIGVPLQMAIIVVAAIVNIVYVARWYYGFAKAGYIIGYLVEIALVCWCFYGLILLTNDGRKMLDGRADAWRVTTSCFVTFIILAVFEVVGTIVYILYLPNVAAIVSYIATAVVWILAVAILFRIRQQR